MLATGLEGVLELERLASGRTNDGLHESLGAFGHLRARAGVGRLLASGRSRVSRLLAHALLALLERPAGKLEHA